MSMCARKHDSNCVQITPDHKSEKVTKIGARLTKLFLKQFSLGIYGISVISKVFNLTR